MKLLIVISAVFFLSGFQVTNSYAQQYTVKGHVTDAGTGESLAFVSIMLNDGHQGTLTDIDGKFAIVSEQPVKALRLSLVGYAPLTLDVSAGQKELQVKMNRQAVELPGVQVYPRMNPAVLIIRKVSANRLMNDYEQLPAFSYTAYEKTFFGPESDSLPYLASLANDTSYLRTRNFFARQHLFLMENVTERSFRFPGQDYRKVIASRVSGLSDPLFVFLVTELQTTSFYKETIRLADKEYVNPIANSSIDRYHFRITDTLVEPYPYDTTFVIAFRPSPRSKFNGLEGTLSISSNGYAVRSVSASPVDKGEAFTVRIQQQYDFIENKYWFPVQLNTDLVFNKAQIILDKRLNTSVMIVGKGRSYISNINLDPHFPRGHFGYFQTDVSPGAYSTSEKDWSHYRTDSLSHRETETYRVIDSIGKARSFDRMSKRVNALFDARFNMGLVDLVLAGMIKNNLQEGLRPTVKLMTSDRLIRWLQLGGYGAYGFKDREFKYGADVNVLINKPRNIFFGISASDDLIEAGATNPFTESGHLINPVKFREILIEKMDHKRELKLGFNAMAFRYMNANLHFEAFQLTPRYNYQFLVTSSENIQVLATQFNIMQAGLTLRYAFGEKLIKNGRNVVTQRSNYPVIWFNVVQGNSRYTGGNKPFQRIDLMIKKAFASPYIGTATLVLKAGAITGNVPFDMLYTAPASFANFSLYSPESFATMHINEFTANRFVSLFLSHNLGSLLIQSRYFNPKPEIVTNAGFGWLHAPELHKALHLQGYEQGFYESGLIINNLIDLRIINLGFGALYRYGPYGLPLFRQNIAVKMALQFIID